MNIIIDQQLSNELIKKTNEFSIDLSLSYDLNLENLNKFVLHSKKSGSNSDKIEVAACINVKCSFQELVNIFRTVDDDSYNIAMKELNKSKFKKGTILYKMPDTEDYDITIKNSYFKKPTIFPFKHKNEQWCYLENYLSEGSGMVISLISMSKDEINKFDNKSSCKSSEDEINKMLSAVFLTNNEKFIHDIYLVYSIKEIHTDIDNDDSVYNVTCYGYSKNSKRRLISMAKSLQEIPNIISKHRLSLQLPISSKHSKADNQNCNVCDKNLVMLKKRCQLCAFNICTKCYTKKDVYSKKDNNKKIKVCTKCLDCVNRCDYTDIQMNKDNIFLKIVQDPNDQYAGTRMVEYLDTKLKTSENKESTLNVINTILQNKSGSSLTSTDLEFRNSLCFSDLNSYLNEIPMLEECELSNVDFRSYALNFGKDSTQFVAPVPKNEEMRLEVVNKLPIQDLINMKELRDICDIINNELQCSYTMITIIDKNTLHVLACSNPELVTTCNRSESICQHMLMDEKPMLITHPETDMRYYNLDPVKFNKIKFYFGMPIKAHNSAVLGALCSFDTTTHEVTASQYSAIDKFAAAASRIIEIRGDISEL